ncbi:MAG TPA: hypothetical protein VMV49_08870 [Candidatus Deferrimicrobium sp.]|nr:hypothetical protein [Candidatus Deferrimicrobium sp.]
MVDEISFIGWRNDIGAYLIMQYPRELSLITQDVMQIYTAHRQNTLFPNFAAINYKGKKIASFFSGLKTTEFVGAPNFIISIYLDDSEQPNFFRDILRECSERFLISLFELLPNLLSKMEDVKGIIIVDIDGFPVIKYPDHIKLSSKLMSDILNMHLNQSKIMRECSYEMDGEKFASFFTGKEEEKFVVVPKYIVVFLLKSEANSDRFKRKISKSAQSILFKISRLLADTLEEINDQKLELIIDEELSDKPILDEKDFERITEEPSILMDDQEFGQSSKLDNDTLGVSEDRRSIEQMLERIKLKTEEKTLESNEIASNSKVEEKDTKELLEEIQYLQDQLNLKDEQLKEKDQQIKKLNLIIKSMRKYVSY